MPQSNQTAESVTIPATYSHVAGSRGRTSTPPPPTNEPTSSQPTPPSSSDPSPTSDPSPNLDAPDSSSDYEPVESDEWTSGPTSGRTRSNPLRVRITDPATVNRVAGQIVDPLTIGVGYLGYAVHLLRRPELRKHVPAGVPVPSVWVPTPAEAEAIAAPLSRIAARRLPESVPLESAGDVADLAALGAALVEYGSHHRVGELAVSSGIHPDTGARLDGTSAS